MSQAYETSAPTFEEVPCDNCGGSRFKSLFTGSDLLHPLPGKFTFVQCLDCGWMRQNPQPVAAALTPYYPDNYLPYANAIEDEKWIWRCWDRRYGIMKRCRSIERFAGKGRLLEVGCGTGIFLNEMRRRGWDVSGVEPNPYASEYVHRRFGLDVFRGLLEQYDAEAGSFDVVASWNVLEHLALPAQGIIHMQRLLKPGGLLVMGFPSYESVDRRIFGHAWIGWDLPRHLYVFPREALLIFLGSRRLRVLDTKCPAGSYHAFLLSLQMWLRTRTCPDHWVYPDMLVELARKLPFRLLSFPIFSLVDLFRLSSLLTYYIRNEQNDSP